MGKAKKIRNVIRRSLPDDAKPLLTPEQMEKLKTAGAVTLAVIAAAGILTLSAVAPNAFVAIEKLFFKKGRRGLSRKEKEQKVTHAFYYLKKHGLILMRPTKNDIRIFLTGEGRRRLKRFNIENPVVPKPAKWNKKWWLVAADIPTKDYKLAADSFRDKLKQMRFRALQRTLWVYPHDPRREIESLSNYYRIGHFVTVMEVSRLDLDDEVVVKSFFKQEGIIR